MPRGKTLLLAGGASITNATFSGQSLFADGTAAAPSISFTTESNVGIFHSTNSLNFSTGSEFARFNSADAFFKLVSSVSLAWSSNTTLATAADTRIARGGAATVYLGDINATDNTGILGDATHRLTNIHTKTVTIGQSLANPLIGEVTLSGAPPLAIIYNSAITATSTTRIFLTKCLQRPASIGAAVAISTSVAGVSATVVSLSAGDTSVVNYWIIPTS